MKFVKTNIIMLFFIVFSFASCEKEISTSPPTKPVPIAYIFIDSNPSGAKIYEDGKYSGKVTPDSLNWLEEKTYLFTLKKELYRDTSFSVTISKDERKKLFIDYFQNQKMYGKINFISTPDSADVFLNGDSTGFTTPDTLSGIIPGNYHIVYKKMNCITDSLEVTVISNEVSDAYLPLVDTTYWVEYSTANSRFPTDLLTTIAIDHNGLMWIGAVGALFSFNGKDWTEYNTSNSGLTNDIVKIIKVDENNNKWIGTTNGLSKFNGTVWINYRKYRNQLPDNRINDIFIQQNNILIATDSGLVKKTNNEWELLYSSGCNGVAIDANNHLWITLIKGGLSIFMNSTGPFAGYWQTYYKDDIYSCIAPAENALWCGHVQIPLFPEATYGLSSIPMSISYVKRDHYPLFDYKTVNKIKIRNNEKWICSNFGLYIFVDYPNYRWYGSENTQMQRHNIMDVAFDNNGNAWVVTASNGLFKFKIPWH